jgi:hypothetical protein
MKSNLHNRLLRWSLTAVAAVAPLSAALAAPQQGGLLLSPAQLPAAEWTRLQQWIAAQKAARPQTFEAVAAVKGCTATVYQQRRNPTPGCSTELRGLGKDHVAAMVSALVVASPVAANGSQPFASDAERLAYTGALVESIGFLYESRGSAVLQAAFAHAPRTLWTRIAAALGRLGGDAELRQLSDTARGEDPRKLAAIHGLGECKRVESATLLANLLTSQPDTSTAAEAANALGRVASAWAWQAMGADKAAQSVEVRTLAARAAAMALAHYSDAQVVDELRFAVMMAEHPDTLALLAEAKGKADGAGRARLDEVARHYASHLKRR